MSILSNMKTAINSNKDMDRDAVENSKTNIKNTIESLSASILHEVMANPKAYGVKDLKDLSSVLNALDLEGASSEGGATPASPVPINIYFNKNLGSTGSSGYDDDESDVSSSLEHLTSEDIKTMIDNTNEIQNQYNYDKNQ